MGYKHTESNTEIRDTNPQLAASHGDFFRIHLTANCLVSIIPNKIAMGDFVIYDLLIMIYYFFPRNQRNPRLLTISWSLFVIIRG